MEVTHIELQDRNKENNDLLDQALKDYHDCAEQKEKGKTSDNGVNSEKGKSTFRSEILKILVGSLTFQTSDFFLDFDTKS